MSHENSIIVQARNNGLLLIFFFILFRYYLVFCNLILLALASNTIAEGKYRCPF